MLADSGIADFDEASYSQIPALIQLVNLGYTYLPRHEVKGLRESKGQYILRPIAVEAIRRINPGISATTVEKSIVDLEKIRLDNGMVKASESVYLDLLSGRAVQEVVEGKKTSPQIRFMDFEHPERNSYHVVAEFELAELADRRPDIVVFVNGIPLAVLECKRGSVPVQEAVKQMLRNQQDNNTPKFFLFPQLLIATNGQDLRYGTTLTPADYYAVWREKVAKEEAEDGALASLNTPIADAIIRQISQDLLHTDCLHFTEMVANEQAKGIYNLLRPERLLDLVHNFIIYDNDIKKIARYQQYFAIHKTLAGLESTPRRGGLIWHTQGSGKSLTMVMLVKALIEKYGNPRIIIITDRRDLDRQISGTFVACNIKKAVRQIKSTAELVRQLRAKSLDVLTTLVQKFDHIGDKSFTDIDDNIFILIDEAHRTQGGNANAWMNTVLPNACQIAFTGTPLMCREKSSAAKFGGIIDAYTISEAEADGTILPLIYQAMFVDMQAHANLLDEFYARITEPLTETQRRDFGRKAVSSQMLEQNSSRIEMIALNIVDHYRKYFQGSGLKGQIVMPSKYSAVICKQAIDLLGGVRAEVIISETNFEGGADDLPEQQQLIAQFFMEAKRRFGSLEAREKTLIAQFKHKHAEGPELLIVVDKLLTGFDAPRNTVLYLAKQLRDHNLLQAIARVNRLFSGDPNKPEKESGIIIDYSKNAKNLQSALELFSNYDTEDIKGTLISSEEKIHELETLYQNLVDLFKGKSPDECLRFLKTNTLKREQFYLMVNKFIRVFSTCLSLYDFHRYCSAGQLQRYSLDLKRFVELKKTTQLAMAEKIDFSKYRDQLHKILDKYVTAETVEVLSKEINLSDILEFNSFVEDQQYGMSDRSKAEAIASQTKKIIRERYKQDPVFYENFSRRIEKLLGEIKDAKQADIATLLEALKDLQKQADDYEDNDIPASIRTDKTCHPFYRNLREFIDADDDDLVRIALEIKATIAKEQCVDWETNSRIQKKVMDQIEDYLYDVVQQEIDITLTNTQITRIAQDAWNIAVNNKAKP